MGLAAGEHVVAAGVRRRVERLKEKWHFQLLSLLLNTHIQSHTHSLDKTLTSITATDQDITQPKPHDLTNLPVRMSQPQPPLK